MSPDAATDAAGDSGRFHTTRWSLILTSLEDENEAEESKGRQALAQLCRSIGGPSSPTSVARGIPQLTRKI
jgi:hypothetical protein